MSTQDENIDRIQRQIQPQNTDSVQVARYNLINIEVIKY